MTEKHGHEVRQRILITARQEFLKFGVTTVTIEHLTSLLGISEKTVYLHFPSKVVLVQEVVKDSFASIGRHINDILNDRTVDFVTRINNLISYLTRVYASTSPALWMDLQHTSPDLWKQINGYRRKLAMEWFPGMIDDGIASGVFRSDVKKEVFIQMWLSAIESILNPDTLLQLPLSPNQALEAIARVMFQGIMTDEARTDILKLAALGQFSATIAHEIRNPLGAISLNFDHLMKKTTTPENLQPVADSIRLGILRIQDIIQGILNFARPQKSNVKRTGLDTIIAQSLQSVSHLSSKKNVQITVDHSDGNTQILADPNQMIQVVTNLVSNAIQAVPTGGLVKIIVRTGTEVEISIADNGPGIPRDKFNTIFEPFYTSKPDGMGLGLAVVRNIIDQHGGRITVESNAQRGATFTIFLPNPDE